MSRSESLTPRGHGVGDALRLGDFGLALGLDGLHELIERPLDPVRLVPAHDAADHVVQDRDGLALLLRLVRDGLDGDPADVGQLHHGAVSVLLRLELVVELADDAFETFVLTYDVGPVLTEPSRPRQRQLEFLFRSLELGLGDLELFGELGVGLPCHVISSC